jgi:hypothetical protein
MQWVGERVLHISFMSHMMQDFISKYLKAERLEFFMEDQAFSPSYDLAPPPPIPPLPSESCLSFSVFLCVAGRAYISLLRIFPVLGRLL